MITMELTTVTEQWSGSSWTEVDLNTARGALFLGTSGTTTSGLVFGGETTVGLAVVEEWNGSAWTETTDLNTASREGEELDLMQKQL